MVTIAVGVQDRPASAPDVGFWVSDYKIINNPSFTEAISALSTLVFAYAGTPAFFPIVSEMRDPRLYTRSVIICQTSVTALYITIGCVVYYYCGSYVASPALGSAGVTMKKIAYGFALPGLAVSTALVVHVSCCRYIAFCLSLLTATQLPGKYVFIRILRHSRHLTANTVIHWVTWLGCIFVVAITAYIIASAIPVFDSLVSLVGALFGSFLTFQPMGCMWLYDNWSRADKSPRWIFGVCWSVFVILSGTFLMGGGTYGSVVSIRNSYQTTGGSGAWSCADNSNSV